MLTKASIVLWTTIAASMNLVLAQSKGEFETTQQQRL